MKKKYFTALYTLIKTSRHPKCRATTRYLPGKIEFQPLWFWPMYWGFYYLRGSICHYFRRRSVSPWHMLRFFYFTCNILTLEIPYIRIKSSQYIIGPSPQKEPYFCREARLIIAQTTKVTFFVIKNFWVNNYSIFWTLCSFLCVTPESLKI